jgi:hypothetical protein
MIKQKLEGHYNYYGVSGNIESLKHYYQKVRIFTFYWFGRKSQRKRWNWEEFGTYESRYPLPKPKLTYAIYNTW